ncbi:hypothetical protein B296_00054624 [Ensete ventricosum]|uniref:Non-haem dioxygenase N-terminal domain-containing protein n=1 Tax=Ensete ventricosum TaxID=4639 RepID=A0A426WYE2_ENSVE|nr:hypothetical protein B296_00054624 [Ensete ventricosum]
MCYPSPKSSGRSIPHYCCPKLVLVNGVGVDRLSMPPPLSRDTRPLVLWSVRLERGCPCYSLYGSPFGPTWSAQVFTGDAIWMSHIGRRIYFAWWAKKTIGRNPIRVELATDPPLVAHRLLDAKPQHHVSFPSLFCSVSLATMVVLSNPGLDQISLLRSPKAIACSPCVPVIDLSKPDAAASLVEACEEFGFLKVTDHGIPVELMQRLEAEAVRFFSLSPVEKERSGPPDPFGYGNRKIGANGDIGWLEYLLFAVASKPLSYTFMDFLREPAACSFR